MAVLPGTELQLAVVGVNRYEVLAPIVYHGRQHRFAVPAGFETDLATIPRIFQGMLPKAGAYTLASVVHDVLCVYYEEVGVSRQDADGIFRRIMRQSGVGPLTRWSMWAAVRLNSMVNTRKDLQDLLLVVPILVFPGTLLVAGGLLGAVPLLLFGLCEWVAKRIESAFPTSVG